MYTALLFILLAWCRAAEADGLIVIPERIFPDVPAYLTLKKHVVDIEIQENHARTKVDEVFRNPSSRRLEGIYIFPLPPGAQIREFSFEINGKLQQGEILEKDQARRIYEDIVRNLKDPALLEYYDHNLFRVSIFPIEPGEDKRIVLSYNELIPVDENTIRYSYPLRIERNAGGMIEELRIRMNIRQINGISGVYCPDFRVTSESLSTSEITVSFASQNYPPEKDFVAYIATGDSRLRPSFISYREKEHDYFLINIFPPSGRASRPISKEIVFVLDSSGSMQGEKFEQAKSALGFCLRSLEQGDFFNLLIFASTVRVFSEKAIPNDQKSIEQATAFLDESRAMGGTNISGALAAGLSSFRSMDLPSYLVFITDGEPTVGLTDPDDILKSVKKKDLQKIRIFALGIGASLNASLLDRLGGENGGLGEYLDETENLELKISSFYRKIASPVLTGVSLSTSPIAEILPETLPDLFAGSPLTIVGRSRHTQSMKVHLTGTEWGKTIEISEEFSQIGADNRTDFLPVLFAQRKIAWLMDQIRRNGASPELIEEVKSLALKFGVVTQYTSFLVTEDRPLDSRRRLENALSPQTGASGVSLSKSINSLRELSTDREWEREAQRIGMKTAGDKTFVNKDGIWQDTGWIKDMKILKIKAYSDEYFKLMRDYPEAGRFLAIGDRLLVVIGNVAYRIE